MEHDQLVRVGLRARGYSTWSDISPRKGACAALASCRWAKGVRKGERERLDAAAMVSTGSMQPSIAPARGGAQVGCAGPQAGVRRAAGWVRGAAGWVGGAAGWSGRGCRLGMRAVEEHLAHAQLHRHAGEVRAQRRERLGATVDGDRAEAPQLARRCPRRGSNV